MTARVRLVELDACVSTQDEARARLDGLAAGAIVAVSTRSQRAGRGREGRSWHDPPGEALLLSIGVAGPLPIGVLEALPRRVADIALAAIEAQVGAGAAAVAWKAPNDLVAAGDGAKLAGILVDARTLGAHVEQLVIGIGCNVAGEAFATPDGRRARSLADVTGTQLDRATLRDGIVSGVAALVVSARP